MLVDGVTVEYRRPDGSIGGAQARIVDFDDPENNDWLAVNQFTVVENRHIRRPGVVLSVNGLSLAIIELKNRPDEQATISSVYQQLKTYKQEIPSLFASNEARVISDGLEARIGTLNAHRYRFLPRRTIDGAQLANQALCDLFAWCDARLERAEIGYWRTTIAEVGPPPHPHS